MEVIEYEGKILPDGHLSCPDELKKHFHLSNGSMVRVSILPLDQGEVTSLKGIWSGVEITAEDIKSAREEMWGNLEAGS